jgi:hypothetical protein
MLRKLSQFMLWLGLFGLFLAFAANSSGNSRPDILLASLILLYLSWRGLRRPVERFDPTRRFRTLRKLGLIDRGSDSQEDR